MIIAWYIIIIVLAGPVNKTIAHVGRLNFSVLVIVV
jgi:hypothetical protein